MTLNKLDNRVGNGMMDIVGVGLNKLNRFPEKGNAYASRAKSHPRQIGLPLRRFCVLR